MSKSLLLLSSFLPGAAVPDPPVVAPPGLDAISNTFLGWLKWGGLVAGMGGLFVCAIMMMIGRRRGHQLAVDGAMGIPWVLGGLALMALAGGIVGAVLQ
jgi:hypothetical protein